MSGNLLFMIESGKALELVRHHISEVKRVRAASRELASELGVDRIVVDNFDNTLVGVEFAGKVHPDFTKPSKKGRSHPKKGTEWAKRFAAQQGHDNVVKVIADGFGVPTSISYGKDDCQGWRSIGNPFHECGFLYLGENGPYAMWIPDVEFAVAKAIKDGYEVAEPALSFKPDFEGCRRIEQEEWELLVAQRNLERKRAELANAA